MMMMMMMMMIMIMIMMMVAFYIELFSTLEKTHCAFVTFDSE